jgi:feruloyl esterase
MGCSLGGRMGIKAAEMFPDDYDGILAGCPAVDFNNLQGWRASFFTITGAIGSPNFINASLWTGLIHNEVLRQCDTLDGVQDNIIEIPDRCFFDPGTLLCGEGDDNSGGTCLNANQTEQLRQIYATYTYPNGTLIYPRNDPGNEILAVTEFFAGAPFSYSQVLPFISHK